MENQRVKSETLHHSTRALVGRTAAVLLLLCSLRLTARTAGFQPVNVGSIPAGSTSQFDIFLKVLAAVESGGDPTAYRKAEKAAGLYQIRPIYLRDVNKIIARQGLPAYTQADRYDPAKSRKMVEIYLSCYCTEARLGRVPTWLDAARIHNGGPNGWKKKSTEGYARRFKEQSQ